MLLLNAPFRGRLIKANILPLFKICFAMAKDSDQERQTKKKSFVERRGKSRLYPGKRMGLNFFFFGMERNADIESTDVVTTWLL